MFSPPLKEAVTRRSLVIAVLALIILAIRAWPAFAQTSPPEPKISISGNFDQFTSAGRNIYDGNFTRTGDHEWYARTRFRPDFEFAVGRTKAVLGIELDLNYGQTGSNDGGFPGNNSGAACGFTGGCKGAGAAGGGLDLNTDVAGLFEVKWIYTEFDLTGNDSLMPFIPFLTIARAGGQPFGTIANYKIYYANGDFAGLDLYTFFVPEIKNHFAYVIVEDQLAGGNRATPVTATDRGKDYAFIFSPEFTPTKGLDMKPMFSWFHADGTTAGVARRNAFNLRTAGGALAGGAGGTMNGGIANGGQFNGGATVGSQGPVAAGDVTNHEERYTLGLDSRWRVGAFGLDPTISYQWGNYDTQAFRNDGSVGRVRGDASAWLFDVIGSYQLGPLLLEARGVYSTGNKARDNLSLSKRYYEPLDLDTGYWFGWLGILGLGGVDYFIGGGGSNLGMSTNIGYDRYGRGGFALRTTYSIMPTLSVYSVVAPTWTAEKVDTQGTGCPPLTVATSAVGCASRVAQTGSGRPAFAKGDSSYLGTEVNGGFTWRFAPNASFDLAGYYLFAGSALDQAETLNGVNVKRDARDGYYAAARVRLSY